jgi:hypothetical protein
MQAQFRLGSPVFMRIKSRKWKKYSEPNMIAASVGSTQPTALF